MNKKLRNAMMTGWIVVIGLMNADTAIAVDASRTIVVHVRNFPQVEENVLERAAKIAAQIFKKAGVEPVVLVETEQDPKFGDRELPPFCHIYVEVLPKTIAERFNLPANALGFAPGTKQDLDRNRVFVFSHIAQELAHLQRYSKKAEILGHAMAHEIGHILLHTVQHSHNGIMQANWGRKAMRRIAQGSLNFNAEQSKQLQAEVVRRHQRKAIIETAQVR